MLKLASTGLLKHLRFPGAAQRTPGWLCINLWPDRVDVSHVVAAGIARPEVLMCESYRTEGGDVATLKRLRRELRLDRFRCTTLMKSGNYQVVQVEAPNVPKQEARSAVRWRIREMIDYPVESATVDALFIPDAGRAAGRASQMFAVAARNDVIAATVKPFNDADIPLEVIDIPELAQRNLASRLEPEGRGLALLAIDAGGALLTFTCGGELFQHRHIELSLSSFDGATPEQRTGHYERLVLELQRSLDHFDRQFSPRHGGTGDDYAGARRRGHAGLPRCQSRRASGAAVPVRGDGLPAHSRAARARAAGAVPADDRRSDARRGGRMSQNINLFTPAFRQQRRLLTLATVAQCLGLTLVALFGYYAYVQQQVGGLTAELGSAEPVLRSQRSFMEKLKDKATAPKPDAKLEDEITQLETQLKFARESMGALKGGAFGNQQGFAEYLRAFSRQSVYGLWLTGFTIAGSGELEIRGRALSPDLVPSYIQRLNREEVLAGRSIARLEMSRPKPEPAPAPDKNKAAAKAPGLPRFLEFNLATADAGKPGATP